MPVTNPPGRLFTVRPGKTRRYKRIRAGIVTAAALVGLLSPSPLEALPASNVICHYTFFC